MDKSLQAATENYLENYRSKHMTELFLKKKFLKSRQNPKKTCERFSFFRKVATSLQLD